jgi:hypothetical protein
MATEDEYDEYDMEDKTSTSSHVERKPPETS